jgi:hypothetical protein
LGSAVVSTAVFGVSPKTLPSFGPAPNGVGRIIVRLAGETPTRATGTVVLPDPCESFRLKEKATDEGETPGFSDELLATLEREEHIAKNLH